MRLRWLHAQSKCIMQSKCKYSYMEAQSKCIYKVNVNIAI